MDNQKVFLQKIRESLGKPVEKPTRIGMLESDYSKRDIPEILQKIRNRSNKELKLLAEIFTENAKPLNLKTHIAESVEKAANTILLIAQNAEPEFQDEKHIIIHDHPDLAEMQLWKKFSAQPMSLHTTFAGDLEIREKTHSSFIGITAPDLAVADSAAVLHFTEPGQPRSTSLLPSIHIAVVKIDKLVADINEAYTILGDMTKLPDSFVFISGPSKTADIEAHLVHGAHGPREMHVIITH